MRIVKLFYDTETTGLSPRLHSIHEISGIVEVNDQVVETFEIKSRPHPKARIEPEALKVAGKTKEEILAYPPMGEAQKAFTSIMAKYVDRFDPKSKAYLIGYNNASFDNEFLSAWFTQCGDTFYPSWFWPERLDVMALAAEYLMPRRTTLPSFKLKRVAKELGVEVDETRLHSSAYDVYLTREIYHIVTGRRGRTVALKKKNVNNGKQNKQ